MPEPTTGPGLPRRALEFPLNLRETFIARQPILDRRLELHGYELLHRSGWGDHFDGKDAERATIELLSTSLLVNGFADLTGGKPGFLNVPENLLLDDLLMVLPPHLAIIEILGTVPATPEVLRAVRRLRDAGYRIALDDHVDEPERAPFLPLSDIVKIDFLALEPPARRALAKRLRGEGKRLLAKKVEAHRDFEEALDQGYELFQGYHFSRPETRTRRDIPQSKLSYLRFLRELFKPKLDLDELEDIIKREMSLSAKLLRYLNSARFSPEDEIDSIQRALVTLGEKPLRQWGSLVAMTCLGEEKPVELVNMCMVRARFCELLALEEDAGRPLDFFLTGMFSALDALVDRPLREALGEIGLQEEIERAIRGDASALSRACRLALACEQGDLRLYQALTRGLAASETRVAELYSEALLWADETVIGDPAAK